MADFIVYVWNGIKYFTCILGSVISFKLSFIFLLCIAYYAYKVFSSFFGRSTRNRADGD
ncbi:MAG: hypothetical protein N3I35_11690 [Clostridia bacterium]|nr:hypothetical protein [Clostridia bacterium]